ncbi:MAG TPA: hypothetical protein VIT41_05885 [Microlunatus sp.]
MTTYEVRINGAMPEGFVDQFDTIQAVVSAGTTLEVDVSDAAALWGLIEALRAAGVELLEVRRQAAESPTSPG